MSLLLYSDQNDNRVPTIKIPKSIKSLFVRNYEFVSTRKTFSTYWSYYKGLLNNI